MGAVRSWQTPLQNYVRLEGILAGTRLPDRESRYPPYLRRSSAERVTDDSSRRGRVAGATQNPSRGTYVWRASVQATPQPSLDSPPMHEDPTRRMDVPDPNDPRQPPDGGGMSTGAKAAIVLLIAAVLGLGVALIVVASDEDDAGEEAESSLSSTTTSSSTTSSSTTTDPTTSSTTTSSSTTSTTTEPTTTTATEETSTSTTSTSTSTVTDLGTITEGGGTEAP